MRHLGTAGFTAGDQSRLFTHTNILLICLENNQSLMENMPTECSPSQSSYVASKRQSHKSNNRGRQNLTFRMKSRKQLHLQLAAQTAQSVPQLSGVSTRKGDSRLRAPEWSQLHLFSTASPPSYILSYHFLQKLGLVQRSLEGKRPLSEPFALSLTQPGCRVQSPASVLGAPTPPPPQTSMALLPVHREVHQPCETSF